MSGITQTEVDGIRTVLAPPVSGQLAAGLFFRVGVADETMATRGITHLIEHLALHGHGLSDLHYNGQTFDLFTHFHVTGTEAEVVDYLNGVIAGLADLPMARMATEKQILRTEQNGRGAHSEGDLLVYRYGVETFGLPATPEHGLERLDEAAVRAWVAEYFTRDNAVLWLLADRVPEGLSLPLPAGRAVPAPTASDHLPQKPAWIGVAGNTVRLQSLVPRSTPASLFAQVLDRALFRAIRQEGGWSYVAGAGYEPRDRDTAIIRAVVDAQPEHRGAVVGAFVDVLARLRWGTITEAELAAAQNAARREITEKDFDSRRLPGYAVSLLLGHENLTSDQLLAEIDAATVADLQAVAAAVYDAALVQVPVLGLDWAGFARAPQWSEAAVGDPRPVASKTADAGPLLVSSEGVSLASPDGEPDHVVTVRFADAVLYEHFADGGRVLHGRDGFRVAVEPTLHTLTDDTLTWLDAAVPARIVVQRPARDAENIPQPRRADTGPDLMAAPPPTTASKAKHYARLALLIVIWLFAILFALALADLLTSSHRDWTTVGIGVLGTVGWTVWGVRATRAWREQARRFAVIEYANRR